MMNANNTNASNTDDDIKSNAFRKVLWWALIINLSLCIIEINASIRIHSISLLADAIDFGGDSLNYAISLVVLNISSVWSSRSAIIKALCMFSFGVFVLVKAYWEFIGNTQPQPFVMGGIAILALCANFSVAMMLYKFKNGNSNMQSVWLCSRNDIVANIAIIFAAIITFYTKNNWADLIVALIMASLAITSSFTIIKLARKELYK